MPRVQFLENIDYHIPGKPICIAYKKGWSGLVTTPCATAAIAKGKARTAYQPIVTPEPEQTNDAESSVSG